MCFFILVLGFLGPRAAVVFTWILTDRVQVAFSGGALLPVVGLIFLPWTTLVYVFAWAPGTGVSALGWMCVAGGFLLDIVTYSNRAIDKKYRLSGY
jgi:hypothetical protein